MHTVHQPPDKTPQHRPQYPPPVDLAAIEDFASVWSARIAARHPLP